MRMFFLPSFFFFKMLKNVLQFKRRYFTLYFFYMISSSKDIQIKYLL